MCKRTARKNFKLILLIILVLQSVNTYKIEEFLYNVSKSHENDKRIWSLLLRKLDKEASFEYVLIVGDIQQHSSFLLDIIEVELMKSVLLNQNDLMHYNLDNYSNNFICIVYLPHDLFERQQQSQHVENYVKRLGEKLDFQRSKRVLMVQKESRNKMEMEVNIALLLEICQAYKFLNVLVILTDFAYTKQYYGFKAYPLFELVVKTFNHTTEVLMYPLKMDNVYGAILRTIPDQVMPRSVVYRDALGRIQVTGYIAQFLSMYAKYINSTLKYNDDLKPGNILFYRDFINWTELDLLDIPCSITPMLAGNTTKLMSYMYEVLSWCLMMPVEEPQTYKDFLQQHLTLSTILLILIMNSIFTSLLLCSQFLKNQINREKFSWSTADIIANAQVILGHLGSSFALQAKPSFSLRIIYVSLFVSGLLYTTTFSVELNAFLTRPPVLQITTLDDMLKYKKVILTASNEYKTLLKLSGETFLPYLSLFKVIESYKEFSEIRSSFNTCCSYPVTSSVWHVYETQQKLFTKPRFRRTKLCFVSLDIMGFILPRNSLHKYKLDTLITRVRDMGFAQYWLQNSFYDLVRIGQMSLTDISTRPVRNSHIILEDFYYIMTTMLKAFVFSLAILLMEIVWHYRRRILRLCEIK